MGKKSKAVEMSIAQANNLNVSDTYNYYDVLNYVAPELKDTVWAAKSLLYVKQHSFSFHDPNDAFIRRQSAKGHLDEGAMKKRIDPVEGTAEYFSSNWKPLPLDVHLDEIIEANIQEILVNLSVKAVDEFSISNRQKNNRKILNRGMVQNIINSFNSQLGYPLLKKTDDPYKYIQNMQTQAAVQKQAAGGRRPAAVADMQQGKGAKKMIPSDIIDNLISEIDNNELLGVYNQFLHKEGVEICCELGINHYLNNVNKFGYNHASNIIKDVKLFNKCAGRMYTSRVSGTPIFQYFKPEDIYISEYSKKDLSDHFHWFFEQEVTFSDFNRMFGAQLGEEKLKEIFEINRKYQSIPAWDECGVLIRNNCKIRVGYVEWESQDVDVYAEYKFRGNKGYKKMPFDFEPGFKKGKNGQKVKDESIEDSKREEGHYNVWYKAYYIPEFFVTPQQGTFDFDKQSEFIFDFGKLQDQERYGDSEQFARSSLVGAHISDRQTWYEIKQEFKEEIDFLWQHVKNDLSNVQPHGLNWIYDFIVQQVATTVTEATTNKKDTVTEWSQKVKQTGSAITKLLRDSQGNILTGAHPFEEIKTGHIASAMEKLTAIMSLYDMMVKALGQNDYSQGGAAKPRTNQKSIEIALGVSGKATFYIEQIYTDFIVSLGNKIIKYFKDIVDDGDSARLQELEDIVGQAHSTALQEIKDIPMRNLGLYVENTITQEQKEMVLNIAQSMASAGTLDIETALYLNIVDNLKQAYAILVFKKHAYDKQQAEQAQLQHQMQLEVIGKQQELELSKIQAAGAVKIEIDKAMISMQKMLQEEIVNLKGHWTILGKEQINQNRIEQDMTKANIDRIHNPEPTPPTEELQQAS